ncbi:MAG TPA: preprotein translocase subunit SecE [Candidatus Hydrogenedentes bacterium]|mgnify:CR=1 FL=1|nr:preprotein translocase subunit SecE [Candidatus Hydrogenedentota bacterium]
MTRQTTAAAPVKLGPIARFQEFLQEVKAEMAKVSWPSQEEIKASTWIVAFLLLIIGGIMFVFDVVFQFAILQMLRLG